MKKRTLAHPYVAHPSFAFTFVWAVTLISCALQLIEAFSDYADKAFILGMALIFSNLAGAFTAAIFTHNKKKFPPGSIYFPTHRIFFSLWVAISIFEIISSGGLPIIWLIQGTDKTYEDFGISTLHGLANALWLFLALSQLIKIVDGRKSILQLFVAAMLFIWPFLVVSRALLTILIIQSSIYLIITSRKNLFFIGSLFSLFIFVFSIAFGIAGNLRAPDFSINNALGFETENNTLVAFLWLYSYIVSPLANLTLNWAESFPSYSLVPENTLSGLLPTVAKNAMGMETGFDSHLGILAHDAFNVGTAFLAPYFDWGTVGIFFSSFMIGAVGHILWIKTDSPSRIPLLAAYSACTALTIFTNQFAQLTPLLSMGLLAIFTKNTSKLTQGAVSKTT